MNARQAKKYLKKRLHQIERDNELMKEIIYNTPAMSDLYDKYNQPLNVIYSSMQFIEHKYRRIIPHYVIDIADYTEYVKQECSRSLAEVISKDIRFEFGEECGERTIEASIYVGIK